QHAPAHPVALPAFPTRRSSDLQVARAEVAHEGHEVGLLGIQEVERERHRLRAGRVLVEADGVDADRGHDLLALLPGFARVRRGADRKSTRLNSSHRTSSYAAFC